REHSRAISNRSLLETSILNPNLRTNSSTGEDRRADRWSGAKEIPEPQSDVMQLRCLAARRSGEHNPREEFRSGLAYPRGCRDDLGFRLANVRAALEQLRWQSNRHFQRE